MPRVGMWLRPSFTSTKGPISGHTCAIFQRWQVMTCWRAELRRVQTCRTAMAACSWCCWGGPATDFASACCRNRKAIYSIYNVIQYNARSMCWWWWWWWWRDLDVNMFVYMNMLICREETICASIYTCTILYYIQCSQSLDAAGLMFQMGEKPRYKADIAVPVEMTTKW